MAKILLIYSDYAVDGIDKRSHALKEGDEENRIYHAEPEQAVEFFKEGIEFDEVWFSETVNPNYKTIFSQPPYNGKQME